MAGCARAREVVQGALRDRPALHQEAARPEKLLLEWGCERILIWLKDTYYVIRNEINGF